MISAVCPATSSDPLPSVGIVVPFHGRQELFDRCLEAVADLDPRPFEVVVVGDGADEAELEGARRRGFRVLATARREGPAAARNRGAEVVATDVVLFVDADVLVPGDTVRRFQRHFAREPDVTAVFGSYDRDPPGPGLVSRYKNLLHHWTHQRAATEADTFWTGCGAIRRGVFLESGGFDPGQRWLEDVELGYRLRAAGHRVVVDASIQVTHLKRWSLAELLVSDICHRAWPWTELMWRYRRPPRHLNTDASGRVSGALAMILAASLLGALVEPWLALIGGAALLGLVVVNRSLYRVFLRQGGWRLLLAGMALHLLYLFYGSVTFALGCVWWPVVGSRGDTIRAPVTIAGADCYDPETASSGDPRPSRNSRSA
jgi:GT2 family glycosyltransferase